MQLTDCKVRIWEVTDSGPVPKIAVPADDPVLSSCWNEDGSKVFFGGCDCKVVMWDPASSNVVQVAVHEKPVKVVKWISQHKVIMTGSWDNTLKFWDGRQSMPVLSVQLPDRLYCADAIDEVAVVATADRHILIFNLANPATPFRTFRSPLRFQSRSCKLFVNKKGFALGSIEGRVAIHHINETESEKNFTFRCHREQTAVHSVNDIAFHPTGIFATCGSDGACVWWNKDTRQNLKTFQKSSLPVTACSWNALGTIFSYAVGYDWSQGTKYAMDNQPTLKPHILLTKGTD